MSNDINTKIPFHLISNIPSWKENLCFKQQKYLNPHQWGLGELTVLVLQRFFCHSMCVCSIVYCCLQFCYLKGDVGSSEAFLLSRSLTPTLQTDTHTYAGPVSAQALQLTPDWGHAVVEDFESTSELCITAGPHRAAARTLPTWREETRQKIVFYFLWMGISLPCKNFKIF